VAEIALVSWFILSAISELTAKCCGCFLDTFSPLQTRFQRQFFLLLAFKMRIILIGLPGSGKTSLGKQLANRMNLPFLDLDEELEREYGKSIPEMFREEGEAGFRLMEQACLKRTLAKGIDMVLATGGGTPCFFDNLIWLIEAGTLVFLNPPIEVIAERFLEVEENPRPLLSGEGNLSDKLSALYQARISFYQKAEIMYAGSDANELKALVQNRN
jgi:shikimate kinase